jgi:hypothetical protein
MNAEKTAIRVLAATAVALLLAIICLPRPVTAEVTIKDNDYQLATLTASTGSDALYVADARTGLIAVFTYDPAIKGLVPRAIRRVDDAFPTR